VKRSRRHAARSEKTARQEGVVGFEMLPLLVLVFAVGILLFAQMWAVLDVKLATTAGSREAARTFVEQPAGSPSAAARAAAISAGQHAATAHGRPGVTIGVAAGGQLERCAAVTFVATAEVQLFRLPLVGSPASITVRSSHSEVVDPYRDGLDGAVCG